MISIVCVFNNKDLFDRRLLASLKAQTTEYELLTVDNRDQRFQNAATALNWGARLARGEWVLFAHQDVALLSAHWLSKAETMLERLSSVGWVGVAGLTEEGEHRGFLRNCAALQGLPFENPVEVQTLDELLLIHRRDSAEAKYFDDAVPGWHGYGVEACCSAIRKGSTNYAFSLAVWHDSPLTNVSGLTDAHRYVWQKHGPALGKIHTTCGVLPTPSSLWDSYPFQYSKRVLRRIRNLRFRFYGFGDTSIRWFHETMDSLTEDSTLVQCLHSSADQDPIEAEGFGTSPSRSHTVIHRFSGLDFGGFFNGDIVIAHDLGPKVLDDATILSRLRSIARRLLVCVRIEDLRNLAYPLRQLKLPNPQLTVNSEGVHIAVFDLSADSA